MKTLKLMLSVIALLFVSVAANATVKHVKPSEKDVLNIYINAITQGQTANLVNLLDDGLVFNIQRGNHQNAIDKTTLLGYIKDNSIVDPSVTTKTTIVQQDDYNVLVKIDFVFANYTRTDVVKLENTNGWLITEVHSSFK